LETEQTVGASGGLRPIMDSLRLAAPGDATVLLQGETGTGKELIARAIHEHSHRRQAPDV
jgi:two-component system response regulator HydG